MNHIERMNEILNRKEDLHPDLKPYYRGEDKSFPVLQSPLVYGVPYHPNMNAYYNEQYRVKKEAIDKAMEKKKWFEVIWLHERPYRFQAFQELDWGGWLDDKTYWEMLGHIWGDSENIWQHKDEWHECLTSDRKYKRYFMEPEERKEFKGLPNYLTVYRGCVAGENEDGFSWTLNEEKAKWFSTRFLNRGEKHKGIVLQKQIRKTDAFAYLTGRNEFEIILLP